MSSYVALINPMRKTCTFQRKYLSRIYLAIKSKIHLTFYPDISQQKAHPKNDVWYTGVWKRGKKPKNSDSRITLSTDHTSCRSPKWPADIVGGPLLWRRCHDLVNRFISVISERSPYPCAPLAEFDEIMCLCILTACVCPHCVCQSIRWGVGDGVVKQIGRGYRLRTKLAWKSHNWSINPLRHGVVYYRSKKERPSTTFWNYS